MFGLKKKSKSENVTEMVKALDLNSNDGIFLLFYKYLSMKLGDKSVYNIVNNGKINLNTFLMMSNTSKDDIEVNDYIFSFYVPKNVNYSNDMYKDWIPNFFNFYNSAVKIKNIPQEYIITIKICSDDKNIYYALFKESTVYTDADDKYVNDFINECVSNSYKVQNYCNIIGTNETEMLVEDTLKKINDCVALTLGPYAHTTIVEDMMKKHSITKDGYTVLRSLLFEDELSRTIFEIVLKISKTLVRKVGDGSTSSIIIAYALYNKIKPIIRNNKITSKDILDIMGDISKELEDIIKEKAVPISDDMENLEHIAAVSCNNDMRYGNLIKEIFTKIGRYGFINLECSLTDNTYYELKNGYEIPRGYICNNMVNQPDKKSVILEDPMVLMVDGALGLNDLDPLSEFLGKYCCQQQSNVVIVASSYSNEAFTFLHANRLNALKKNQPESFSLVAIDIATKNTDDRNRFEDLAINLGAKPIRISDGDSLSNYMDNIDLLLTKCGYCNQFKGDEFNSKFIEGKGNKESKDARVKELMAKLEEVSKNETTALYDQEVYEIRKRMALLQNSMASLYVGGDSEQEKQTDMFLLEDAVSACKSALKYGYVFGGNLIIPSILNNRETFRSIINSVARNYPHVETNHIITILENINDAFKESFKSVLKNFSNDEKWTNEITERCISEGLFYNLKTHSFVSVEDTKIINSAQTDIEIMNTAISIIGLVATSDQFIGLNPRRK